MKKLISLLLSITILLSLNTVTVTARTVPSNKIHTSISAWEEGGLYYNNYYRNTFKSHYHIFFTIKNQDRDQTG